MDNQPNSIPSVVKQMKNDFSYKQRMNRRMFWRIFLITYLSLCTFTVFVIAYSLNKFPEEKLAGVPADIEATAFTVSSIIVFAMFSIFFFRVLLLLFNIIIVHRLHDTGRSGWCSLLSFVPVLGDVPLLVMLSQKSEPKDNKWGACPN